MTSTRIHDHYIAGPKLELYVSDCAACGVVFAMTADFEARRRQDRKTFYCPAGHTMVFGGKTDEQKLREADARETALRDQLEAAARENELTKAALLRDRARFAAGVCPCCNRTFTNVARHMSTQHPDYDVTKIQHGDQEKPYACSCGRRFHTIGGLHQHQTKQRRPGWFKPTASNWAAHLTEV